MVDNSQAIKYVCISDTHMGEEDSLLTALKNGEVDSENPSPVMVELVKCLRHLFSEYEHQGDLKPTLIINGDILEMALCDIHQSATVFDRFLDLTMPEGDEMFDKMVYIPGNHDQHIWEMARATQYSDYLLRYPDLDIQAPDFMFEPPWHKTNIFMEEEHGKTNYIPDSYFLNAVVARYKDKKTTREKKHSSEFKIWVAYPNFGILSDDDKKCVLVHHGHFAEPIYRLLSTLNNILNEVDDYMPTDIDELQRENFAWIEFFWSMLGRSGEVGETVESLWEQISDEEHSRVLARRLAQIIVNSFDLPGRENPLRNSIVNGIGEYLVDKVAHRERMESNLSMSPEMMQQLTSYLKYPLWNQMRKELKGMGRAIESMPDKTVFIVGHTHKPMQRSIDLIHPVGSISIYNTGGWVIDKVNPNPIYGGAIALIDSNLNVALIEMFREACKEDERRSSPIESDPEKRCRQKVILSAEGSMKNDLTERLKSLIKPSESPWREFSAVAADEMTIREKNISKRLAGL